jgi:MscS family membrane protein
MFDIDRRHHFAVAVCACLLGVCAPLSAQTPGAPAPASTASPPSPPDPLGRGTPFGTITGFSTAAGRSEFQVAGRYLQTDGLGAKQVEDLARDLSELLDRYFTGRLTALSMQPAGDLADGLEPNRERITLNIGDRSVDLFLSRVTDRGAGQIWLISSDSLTRVPTLRRSEPATWVERIMPESLVSRSYIGLSLAQSILWAASILAPLLLFWGLTGLVSWVVRRRIADGTRRAMFLSSWRGVRWLLIVGLTLIAHLAAVPFLGLGVTSRFAYSRFVLTVIVIVASLLMWRLVTVTFQHARLLAMRRGRSSMRSVIQLGERVVKVLVILISLFSLLALAGVNPTTALAGVGIVGLAAALGAQKSVENLLGGVFLLTDQVLAVGDYCRLADREGWVEDITLRSVRLRTLEQTLLSVPAGQLSQASIENFTSRGKILFQSVLRLRYGTTSEQLHAALAGMRQLLAEHPLIDKETARVRLTAFGPQAIEVELFAYVITSDFLKFLEIREGLLLQAAIVVESSGGAFAIPTQFIYMRSEADEQRQWLAHQTQ